MSATTNPVELLENLIRARRPIITISTHEEARMEAFIQSIANLRDVEVVDRTDAKNRKLVKKAVWRWTITDGLRQVSGPRPPVADGLDTEAYQTWVENLALDTEHPTAALKLIRNWQERFESQDGKFIEAYPALLIFADLVAQFVGPDLNITDETIARCVRDIAREWPSTTRNTLLLISPNASVPRRLEKDVALLDWPLPSRTELAELVAQTSKTAPVEVHLNGDEERLVNALTGITHTDARNALQLAIVTQRRLDASAIEFVLNEKERIIRQSGLLEYVPPDVTDADIGGLDVLKDVVSKRRAAFTQAARQYGLDYPRPMLLVGVPGTGKSLITRAIAGGAMPVLNFKIGSVLSKYMGESESNVRHVFKVAEAVAPCILRIDEIDKDFAESRENDVVTRIVGLFLQWVQEKTAPVYVTATANKVTGLRSELIARFGDVLFVDLPGLRARAEIFGIHLRRKGRDAQGFQTQLLAEKTSGYSGREIAEKIIPDAMSNAFADGREFDTDDLLAVIATYKPLSVIASADIQAMQSWQRENGIRLAETRDEKPAALVAQPKSELATLEI